HREREVVATTGPWDETDAPDDGIPRIDLGAIRIPGLPGMDLRVELDPQGQVVAATLRAGNSQLQVAVFAAPRAPGIWDDVRGNQPMPVREQLPLTLPAEAAAQLARQQAAENGDA